MVLLASRSPTWLGWRRSQLSGTSGSATSRSAGHAAAAAAFRNKMPGSCLTVSAPGLLNGLVALADTTTNRSR